MKKYVGFLSCVFTVGLNADSAVLPTEPCDLSGLPPSATRLLRQEREYNETQALASVKEIMEQVVTEKKNDKKLQQNGNGKKTAKKCLSNKAVKSAVLNSLICNTLGAKNSVPYEVTEILQKQYFDPELENKKVTMHLKKMPIRDALALVSKTSGLQLIIDGDVTGEVQELILEDVPLAAALHSILGSNQPRLALVKDLGVWRVLKLQTAQELFAGDAARQHEKDFAAVVITIEHAKWNDALKQRIEKLWLGITQGNNNGDKQNVYLMLDDVNRKIFCKARRSQIQDFNLYVRELDVQIPQIRIDVRVVLADKDFEDALGFNWSGVYNRRASVKHFDFVGLGPITKLDSPSMGNGATACTPFKDIVGWALNLIPTTAMRAFPSNIKIPFVFGNKDMNTKRLNLELNAAENRSEIKTILKPSLLVYNDECAEILVGEQMPTEVRLDETIESQLTNITTVNYKDIGMQIKVKPRVSPNHQSVFLDVFVENSVVTKPDLIREQGIGSTRSSFNYTIRTSRSRNRVLLRSGQTTLIGGLINNSTEKEVSGVPWLQDIPILGKLFQSTRNRVVDRQLLIFITPTLVDV